MNNLHQLQQRLKALEAEIAKAKQRLPAHSVKPAVMQMLLDLEDEYDRVMRQMDDLRQRPR